MNLITPEFGLLFWQTVLFLLLLFLLTKFAWKPIMAALSEREDSIESALRMADQAKIEMQQLKAGNEKLLAEARQERDRMMQEATVMANQHRETEKARVVTELDQMRQHALADIENARQAALTTVKNTAAQLSLDIAERILRRQLTDAPAQNQLVADYLKEVKLN